MKRGDKIVVQEFCMEVATVNEEGPRKFVTGYHDNPELKTDFKKTFVIVPLERVTEPSPAWMCRRTFAEWYDNFYGQHKRYPTCAQVYAFLELDLDK